MIGGVDKNINFRVTADTGKAIRAFKGLEGAAGRTSQAVGKTMPTGAKQASFAMLNFNRIAQDSVFFMNSMQMGVMAVSNNLPIFIESMDRLKQTTGGTRGAMKLFAQQFLTMPNLLMLGVTALTAWGIAATQSSAATNKLANNIKKAAGSLIEVRNPLSGQKVMFDEGSLTAGISKLDEQIKLLKGGAKTGSGLVGAQGNIIRELGEALGIFEKSALDDVIQRKEAYLEILEAKKAELVIQRELLIAMQQYGGELKNLPYDLSKENARGGDISPFGGVALPGQLSPVGTRFKKPEVPLKRVSNELVQIQQYAMMAGSSLQSAFMSGANAAQAFLNTLISIATQLALISGVKSLVSLGTGNPISFFEALTGTLGLSKAGPAGMGGKVVINIDGREVAEATTPHLSGVMSRTRRLRN